VQLRPEPHRPGGWTLLVDGVEQSYVDAADPLHLEFEYMRRLAWIVDACAPPRRGLRVLHLGGGAYTMPRYVAATRPGSSQLVVEQDAALVALIARELPLPVDADVTVLIGDARSAVEGLPSAEFDVVLADVYEAAQMPLRVATVEYVAQVARVLRPGGVYAVNIADQPLLAFTRMQMATALTAFADVCLLAEPGLLRGRRYGNAILTASPTRQRLPVDRLVRLGARQPFPVRIVHGDAVSAFVGGARPIHDGGAAPRPRPRRAASGCGLGLDEFAVRAHDEPDTVDALSIDVAGADVADVVVQRPFAVGRLTGPLGPGSL
jgi:spermidine synthase